MPKVSICIPTYNQVVYLKRTLDSVLSQTYQDYEVIISDDTPGFIVKDLVEQYNFNGKLCYSKNVKSLGTPQNWNECIKKATGDYIKILHHDDWFTTDNSLQQYVDLLLKNPNCFFAFSGSFVLLADGTNWVHQISASEVAKIQSHPLILFAGNKIGSPSAVIYKRKIFEYYDENLKWLVDVEFYIRVIDKFRNICFTQDPLVTTFAAEDRVTDHCSNNPKVEIFENFYVFKKSRISLYDLSYFIKNTMYLIQICEKINITKRKQIKDYGYTGKIPIVFVVFWKLRKISAVLKSLREWPQIRSEKHAN